ncbi:hypothetical protein [Absidia glauca]|uniref:Uncharacterized protein n=1 Tax=Absidia glauca TaxID=4829 RepID=A0A163LZI4_ABSGL|nr:hypothetical protein [Absidia glauca]
MSPSIHVVTRLDRHSPKAPQVTIAGSYDDKEQAYKTAMILQLEQMLDNASTWSAQAIQHRRDNILKRCHGLPTAQTYQTYFEHLFPPHDNLFDDLCNVRYQVHTCDPVNTPPHSEPGSVDTSLVQQLMAIFQASLDDEEDLDDDSDEDDDDEDEEEDEVEDDEDDEGTQEVDLGEDDSDDPTKLEDGSDDDDDDEAVVDEIVDDDSDEETSEQQQHKRTAWQAKQDDDDEIDELNDDDDDNTPNKRRKPNQ